MRSIYTPFIGIYFYLKTFGPEGRIYGLDKALFAFFMAFYHSMWYGIPLGLIASKLFN